MRTLVKERQKIRTQQGVGTQYQAGDKPLASLLKNVKVYLNVLAANAGGWRTRVTRYTPSGLGSL